MAALAPIARLHRGIDEFNRREYFAAHDTLEILWREDDSPLRSLYQGIIQIAAAFIHVERKNQQGALALLDRGIQNLTPFFPTQLGLEIENFAKATLHCRGTLATMDSHPMSSFPWNQAPRIEKLRPQQHHHERATKDRED